MAMRFPAARSCRFAILLAATIGAVPAAAFAQDQSPKQQQKIPADRTRGLEFLFGALKAAPDEISAKHVEARIWAIWLQTPSDTVVLLMTRAKAATDAQNSTAALKLLV